MGEGVEEDEMFSLAAFEANAAANKTPVYTCSHRRGGAYGSMALLEPIPSYLATGCFPDVDAEYFANFQDLSSSTLGEDDFEEHSIKLAQEVLDGTSSACLHLFLKAAIRSRRSGTLENAYIGSRRSEEKVFEFWHILPLRKYLLGDGNKIVRKEVRTIEQQKNFVDRVETLVKATDFEEFSSSRKD
ncbi:hypothetical protein B0H13DRAFT_1866297 [Mycena leptocephala]|nr:hypothetical protein B0H13DRAFT_1866297 [Mycena leptocephala]